MAMLLGPLLVISAASPSAPPAAGSDSAAPAWIAFIAALGIGSFLGSLAVSVLGYLNGERQRKHEGGQREADRRHQREMADNEYQHRREDQRRQELRDGLASVIDAVLDLERWLTFVGWPDQNSQDEAARVLTRATGEFVKARAGLLLDQDGERIVRATAALSLDADRYRGMLIERQQLVAAGQPGGDPQLVQELAGEIREMNAGIHRRIEEVITDARLVLNRNYGAPEREAPPATGGA